MGYTYSRWDGSQAPQPLDADEVMEALADRLTAGENLHQVLLSTASRGIGRRDGTRVHGLQELLNQIRNRREDLLDRAPLDSVVTNDQARLTRMDDKSSNSASDHQPEETAAHSSLREHNAQESDVQARFQALRENMRQRSLERNMSAIPRSAVGIVSCSPGGHTDQLLASNFSGAIQLGESPQANVRLSNGMESDTCQGDPAPGDPMPLETALHHLEQLDRELKRARETGDLSTLDVQLANRVLGAEAANTIGQLQQLSAVIEAGGFVHREANRQELTAEGVRKLGEKALGDIFRRLAGDGAGDHPVSRPEMSYDTAESSRPHQFGDPFQLDLGRTIMNAIHRNGASTPVRLRTEDFEVFLAERRTKAATVLMLDVSRSMPRRGCFVAAKRMALALHALIRMRYPRDRLHVLAFSDRAREIRLDALHQATWGEHAHGTNMQHGFLLARRLLARQSAGARQIILITDGEPTAHIQDGHVQFDYPSTPRTLAETLREVRLCTREKIVINTFMLDRNPYLMEFVNLITRINRGRTFLATPDRLGEYVVADYVRNNG